MSIPHPYLRLKGAALRLPVLLSSAAAKKFSVRPSIRQPNYL